MTVNELLSRIQELKTENKLRGDSKIVISDLFDREYFVEKMDVDKDGNLVME